MQGRIKRLIRDQGYGFIQDGSGQDYFFHRSALIAGIETFPTLMEEDIVEFETEASTKGPRATNVRPARRSEVRR